MSAPPQRLARTLALVLLPSLFACSDPAAEPPRDATRPSVLLITIDTLRADHLGAYSRNAPPTPHLDRLARQATLFERAATPMPMTRPAHFSIFTARYPREHGVLNNALSLPDEALTLAEIFRDAGYRTGGFVAVKLLSRESGAAQGFDEFSGPKEEKSRPAEEAVAEALEFIAADDEPFLLWVHLFDPHLPYNPPDEYRGELSPKLASELPEVSWKKLKRVAEDNQGDVPLAVLEHAMALYRGEVSYVDHWVGKLIEGFDLAREPQHSILVFTADHGECFEAGVYFEHADCLYQGAIRVPLLIRHSDFAAGARFGGQVSSIDLAPTILRSAGMELSPAFSGRPLQDQRESEDRYVLLQHPFYQEKVAGGRTRRQDAIRSVAGRATQHVLVDEERAGIVGRSWKWIRAGDDAQLYSQPASLGEGEQLSALAQHPQVVARLDAALREQLDRHGLELIEPGEINNELLETLRALGYLGEEDPAATR